MTEERKGTQLRTIQAAPADFTIREEEGTPTIEGYFAVYNSPYEIASGMSESIAPGAFQKSLSSDIRMLVNHDTTLVVGRTAAHTMELRDDSHGLWAKALVNPKDSDAMNAHARVERGDVSQCSIGFEIIKEDTEFRDDGSVHWTILEAELREVSICTFPAYKETNVSARSKDRDEAVRRINDAWREKMTRRLKHGTETDATPEEDQRQKEGA